MRFVTVVLLAAMAAAPAFAQVDPTVPDTGAARPLSAGMIFADAALLPKIIILLLLAAMVAAVVVCVRKLMSGPKLAGGSAFLSSLRAGGPLLGLIGGGYGLLNSAIGLAVVGPVPFQVLLPGLIESLLIVLVGLVAGVVAICAHWAVEARIDRQVLRA